MIHYLDEEEEINKLKEKYEKVEAVINSRREQRGKYRTFSQNINLAFEYIDDCIDSYEFSLLISCYTLSEKLFKHFIYEMLDKDSHRNTYLNLFINNKINPNKFSPNVKIESINKELSNYKDKYELLLSKTHTSLKKYDEMINARHKYAHANNYPMRFEDYKEVIFTIEYLIFEYKLFLGNINLRINMQKDFKKIESEILKICGKGQNHINFRNYSVKELRDNIKKFLKKYRNLMINVELLKNIVQSFEELERFDLRTKDQILFYDLCKKISISISSI